MTRATDARGSRPRILHFSVAILFALLFAYDLIEAITNLIGVPSEIAIANQFALANGLQPLAVPWGILIVGTLLPVVAFAVAWWVARRRSVGFQALLYLVALAVVAAVTLTLTALV